MAFGYSAPLKIWTTRITDLITQQPYIQSRFGLKY